MFVRSELFVVDILDVRDTECMACNDGYPVLGVWLLDPVEDALYGEFCHECLIAQAADWHVPVCAVLRGLVSRVTEPADASS